VQAIDASTKASVDGFDPPSRANPSTRPDTDKHADEQAQWVAYDSRALSIEVVT
jgi:hypothetical protein